MKMPLDLLLFGATILLVVIGLWMVFSSSYIKTLDNPRIGDAFFFVKRQAFGAVVGLFALFVAMKIDYTQLRRFAVPLLFVGFALLLAVWIPGIGRAENGASRWIYIKSFGFQPSELAKIILVLYLAARMSRPNHKIRDFTDGFLPPLAVIVAYLFLIEREPDLGTATVLFLAVMTQLYVACARKRHLALVFLIGALLTVVMIGGFGHRGKRITTFLNPEHDKQGIGYQIYHSKLAIGSGGWMGAGLGQGKEKYFLPQADSDFIFATVAEEFGFFRTLPILGLLCLVGWRGFRIAYLAGDRFGALLATGIAAVITWQALINIAVTTASIPATGVPLPFLSYGSTSLVVMMMGVGLLLNIAQHSKRAAQDARRQD
jgi:cell division protein FtsW